MRKLKPDKRIKVPDPVYNSVLVGQLINQVMRQGKKNLAQKMVYQTLIALKKRIAKKPLEILNLAVETVKPKLEVKSRKVGGARYQVPVQVNPERQITLALRWIVQAAKKRTGKPFIVCLSDELEAATKRSGEAFKKKENIYKMAQANKAFAYFSW